MILKIRSFKSICAVAILPLILISPSGCKLKSEKGEEWAIVLDPAAIVIDTILNQQNGMKFLCEKM